jgi:NodT family efflux transporter outer membrane factor (OMF) lipoprotein
MFKMRINPSFFGATLIIAAAVVLVGCSVGPNYKAPEENPPASFSEMTSATRPAGSTRPDSSQAATRPDYLRWWETLNDPELNRLIDRAAANNPDLLAAEARIREARATRGVVISGFFPQVNANGSYTSQQSSKNLPGFSEAANQGINIAGLRADTWQAGFDMAWELDVFGQTRRQLESSEDAIQAAVWDRRDVQVSLFAEVAVNYIALRTLQRELDIASGNLADQQQTLDLTRRKAEGGLVPYLDVAQQEAQVASTASTIPNFEANIRVTIHHLSILLGEDPGALSDELTPTAPIPIGPSSVPPSIPGELLRRRPDIRRTERQLAEATANIGVATADLYPKFSVTGAFGQASETLTHLFDHASQTYNIVPGVTWDIFDAGKVMSNIKVQNEKQAEALEAYRKAVLQSLSDVDDSLVTLNREQVRLKALQQAVSANQRAVDLSTELFQKGSADFLSVLDAQRNLFIAQDAMAQSEQNVSSDLVALYKALGGGWQ